MNDVDTKRDHLIAIEALLAQALTLSDKAGEHALGAHLAHAQACVAECLERVS